MYDALTEPAEHFFTALGDLYHPGQLAVKGSSGSIEIARLEKTIVSLTDTVTVIRTQERARFDRRREGAQLLSRALLHLLGLLHADNLVPDAAAAGVDEPPVLSNEQLEGLRRVRVHAALALATMNVPAISNALSERLRAEDGSRPEASWLEETLHLRFVGTDDWPWPLDPAAAARATRWLPCACRRVRGGVMRVERRTSSDQRCTACNSGTPVANTMNVRLHRLRSVLRDLLCDGLDRRAVGLKPVPRSPDEP